MPAKHGQVLFVIARRPPRIIFHIQEDQQAFGDGLQTKEIKQSGQWLLQIGGKHIEHVQQGHSLIHVQSVVILCKKQQDREYPRQEIDGQHDPCDNVSPARKAQDSITVEICTEKCCLSKIPLSGTIICFTHGSLRTELYFAVCYNYGLTKDSPNLVQAFDARH